MKKKGFTLVELLAVISILAVLVLMIAPNVINTFNTTKKQNFVSETREVCRSATNTYLRKSLMSYSHKVYSNIPSNPTDTLDLQGRKEFKYCVHVNTDGEVVGILTYDGDNAILVVNENGVDPNNITDHDLYSVNPKTMTYNEAKNLVGYSEG